jgi:hypothetical protein
MKKKSTWIILLIILLALSARIIPGPRTSDDAYITFRYARNILAGNGFVYNPGESVLGTTTPLYTLLISFLGLFSGGKNAPLPGIAWIFNALLDSVNCLLLIQLAKKLTYPLAGYAAALVWAIAPFSVTFAIGGLETSLYIFLLIGMMLAYLSQHHTLSAFAAGLALLTRPDAILLIAPLVLDRLLLAHHKQKKIRLTEWLALLVIPLLWFAYATLKFGSPIPHSLTAKMAVYQLGPAASLIRFIQHYATPFMDQHLFGINAIRMGIFIYPFLCILGIREALRKNKHIWPLAIFPWVYLLAFTIPNPLIFRWYLTPPLPAYILFIFIGIESIAVVLLKSVKQIIGRRMIQGFLIVFLFIYPLTANLQAWELHPDHGNSQPAPQMAFIQLELLYKQAAELISPYLQPGDVLAAGDVGVLGYVTHAKILDTVGLNSAQSLVYYPIEATQYVINYAIPTALILNEKPDAIIILEVYARKTFLPDPLFNRQYHLLQTLPTDLYGSDGMLIFLRSDK